jgi:hypothetical protein
MSSFSILLLSVVALGCTPPLTAAQSQVYARNYINYMLHGFFSWMIAVWPDAMPQSAPYDGLDLQHRSAAEKRHFCATELGSGSPADGGDEIQPGVAGIQHAGQLH